MTRQDDASQLLTIGDFAGRARLTPKALRIYDDLGLLSPVEINSSNGYRYYATSQLETARLIGLLRGVDMSLHDIGKLLEASDDEAAELLNGHINNLESIQSSRRLLARHIHATLRQEEPTMFTIQTRSVAEQRVMSIQRRLFAKDIDNFVTEAKQAFNDHLGTVEAAGPFTVIFHGIVDHEQNGPIEIVLGCDETVQATDQIGIRTEPAHDVAYTTITKAEWAFPAILAAYDAVACSPEVAARGGSPLSCREVYVAEPDDIGDDDHICDVAFPLA